MNLSQLDLPVSYVLSAAVQSKIDPTRTLTLRNRFAQDMNARFNKLKKVVKTAIIDRDCFGLNQPTTHADPQPPPDRAFAFPLSQEKVVTFMTWLRRQEQLGVLAILRHPQIGTSIEPAWTDIYINSAYGRGVTRARQELRRAGYAVPTLEQTGGLASAMMGPFHSQRVGVLYSRSFSSLRGITEAMDNQISQVLARGLIDGEGPRALARKLVATIDGTGSGTLGLTDTLGRFIPAQRRAEMLARTEMIRAHAQGQLQEMRNWGVEGVHVVVEWVAGGRNVCPACMALQGQTFSIDEAMNKIPLHPQCRCCWLPREKDEK